MAKEIVLVAMSGGVDSSVTAAILKQSGYDAIGITMRIWECEDDWHGCCGIGGLEDARTAARQIGIPHYVIDLRKIFEEKIIKPFCLAYFDGRTPNPCVLCNGYIKFGALLARADELGAQFVATGHYACIERQEDSGIFLLKRADDLSRDQSYFLYMLSQEQLPRILFPVGRLTKSKVRELARQLGLHIADKPASQEICFIPDGNYIEFVSRYLGVVPEPGPIVSSDGKVLGRHSGILSYTIGQRKRLGLGGGPFYVVRIAKERNTVVVGRRSEVYCRGFIGKEATFINEPQQLSMRAKVRVRYRQPTRDATIEMLDKGKVQVTFDDPQWGVAPGQAAVFYDQEVVLGGATIDLTVGA